MNLPHGCTAFEISVHCTNWNTEKENVKEIWYINSFLDILPSLLINNLYKNKSEHRMVVIDLLQNLPPKGIKYDKK